MDENNIFDADDFQRKIIRDPEAWNLFQRPKVDTLVDDDGAAGPTIHQPSRRSEKGRINGAGQTCYSGFARQDRRRFGSGRSDGDDVLWIFELQSRQVEGFSRKNLAFLRRRRDRLPLK